MQRADQDVTSIPESVVTTASEVSIPEEVLEMCTTHNFDSDGTTVSDVEEDGVMPNEILEMCTRNDFDSDATTASGVEEDKTPDEILKMCARDNFDSDRMTASDVEEDITPDEILKMCTRNDFDSDATTASDVGEEDDTIPNEILEMCTRHDFDSDVTTISDVAEEDDNDFTQWTDSLDALVASFDQAAENPAGIDISQKSCETVGTRSTLFGSPVSPPHRSGAGMLASSTTSPSKRRLELTFDSSQGPPSSRQRQVADAAVVDTQSEVSPLRNTLTSRLSLRMP